MDEFNAGRWWNPAHVLRGHAQIEEFHGPFAVVHVTLGDYPPEVQVRSSLPEAAALYAKEAHGLDMRRGEALYVADFRNIMVGGWVWPPRRSAPTFAAHRILVRELEVQDADTELAIEFNALLREHPELST